MKAYLVIKTGYEGIDELCYLTENEDEAVTELKRLRAKAPEEERETWTRILGDEADTDEFMENMEDPTDFYCIQEWNGKEFNCVCGKLGVPTKRGLMLR